MGPQAQGWSSNRIHSLLCGVPPHATSQQSYVEGTVITPILQMRKQRHGPVGNLPKATWHVGREPRVKPEQSGCRVYPRNQQQSPKTSIFLSEDVVLDQHGETVPKMLVSSQ